METSNSNKFWNTFLGGLFIVGLFVLAFHYASGGRLISFAPMGGNSDDLIADAGHGVVLLNTTLPVEETAPEPVPEAVSHIETPDVVKALYMTAWVAGTPSLRDRLIELIKTNEANAVVIDIKDATGTISYVGTDEKILTYKTYSKRIPNPKELIERLHADGIYVIGRISVFQDPKLATLYPTQAVQKLDGTVWADRKGLSFMDVQSSATHDYVERIALEASALGFDEINLDYVRFPTDGNLKDVKYPISGTMTRTEALKNFFVWVDATLRKEHGLVVSADVFGLTTTATDDLGIGQTFEVIAPYVDYIYPMIYPSHYAKGFNGFANPATRPGEVVAIANQGAIKKLDEINAKYGCYIHCRNGTSSDRCN
jgi:hypothetical protein